MEMESIVDGVAAEVEQSSVLSQVYQKHLLSKHASGCNAGVARSW